jgi:hypothetical protein
MFSSPRYVEHPLPSLKPEAIPGIAPRNNRYDVNIARDKKIRHPRLGGKRKRIERDAARRD